MDQPNGLTIEKFEINKRLAAVETQVALLKQSIDELKNTKNEVHDHLAEGLKEQRIILYGVAGGQDGLIIQVNDLWKQSLGRARHLTVIYGVIITLIVHTIWRHFVINSEITQIQHRAHQVSNE